MDPSNIRPLLVCLTILGALAVLQVFARRSQLRNVEEIRKGLFCKHGSFSSPVSLVDVPQDVSRPRDSCVPLYPPSLSVA
jgi:hypothetical protein